MKKHKSYPYNFAINDEYITQPKKHFLSFLPPSLRFHANLIRIVLYSNIKTKFRIYDRYNWSASSYDVIHSLERIGVRFHIKGMKNYADNPGPFVFISNHMGTTETVVLPALIQPVKSVVYVIKKELTTYPVFGPVGKARHPIIVGRQNPREDLQVVLEEGSKRLADGRSIIIFPQKTRGINLELKTFNSLGIKLAKRNNVSVIPIALKTDAWANGKKIKELGKIDPSKEIKIEFGAPIQVKGNGSEEHQAVLDFIKSKYIEWGMEKHIVD
ncbi:MAG: lysophospholipid acyltransferase family protein [bacterium]